jgi:hypothetical protein
MPESMEYLRIFAMDTAYIPLWEPSESQKKYRCRVYKTMQVLLSTEPAPPLMRIEKQWPHVEWNVIWRNIHATPANEITKVTWYEVIQDIIPTRVRLNKIRLATTAICERCDKEDNITHRLTECNAGRNIWSWTCKRLAMILRMDWRRIPLDWLIRPDFQLWPPKRHRAVLWILANFVIYRLQEERTQSLLDYYDFLRRTHWKLEQLGSRSKNVGNYLNVLTLDAR